MQLSIPTINGALAATYSKQAAVAQTYKGHPSSRFPLTLVMCQLAPIHWRSLSLTTMQFR